MRNVVAGAPAADANGYDYLQGNLQMLLVALAAVYVVSSFGEEALYRGFLINRVMGLVGHTRAASAMAILASAVVFGLAHFDWGIVGIVQTAFMGPVLAVGYVVTKRNLWALVLAHACMDTLLLVRCTSVRRIRRPQRWRIGPMREEGGHDEDRVGGSRCDGDGAGGWSPVGATEPPGGVRAPQPCPGAQFPQSHPSG
jgi:hypothetical protein